MYEKELDILIIGGGHAGIEAACIAARFNLQIGLVTLPNVPIASAPCNPAIGGVGKGQVVREIDALGGVMGKLADLSAIQCRILNESKGYAVQSTRFQIDKDIYPIVAKELVESFKNIKVFESKVNNVIQNEESFLVETTNEAIRSKLVIVTTGTFLSGKMHTGREVTCGGRVGSESSKSLSDIFNKVSCNSKRFKTGTPARINKDSINYSSMVVQSSDPRSENFHYAHGENTRFIEQLDCYITHTNEKTLKIIRDNKENSPIFNGQIKGIGPRYCPSIEDKAYRYEDKDIHHVFVEPEGHQASTCYPNGISTSLPKEIQEDFIRTIDGLESAEIEIYGYAVEYDVVDTLKLDHSLESSEVEGLFFAGQVNGTSGYEEAAAQGLIAGINAVFKLQKKNSFTLNRKESYIGVLIDDLVTSSRDEPYRLFTARSENRLFIREDNTFLRIYPYRKMLDLDSDLDKFLREFNEMYDYFYNFCNSFTYKSNSKNKDYFKVQGYGDLNSNITLSELVRRSSLDPIKTLSNELMENGLSLPLRLVRSLGIGIKYDGYIKRAEIENARVSRYESKPVNVKMILNSKNISFECKQRIKEVSPRTFGQLQKIEGVRPATLAYIAGNML